VSAPTAQTVAPAVANITNDDKAQLRTASPYHRLAQGKA
jgi:hypothetical protein